MDTQKTKFKWLRLVSMILNIFLILEVGFLIKQNRELRSMVSPEVRATVKPGDKAESFVAISMDSTIINYPFSSSIKKSLFFVLSPGCKHCENTLPKWKQLNELPHS